MTTFIFFSFFCILTSFASPSDELRLEGILYEESRPEDSMAVVNGAFVKTGDAIGNYRIAEITPRDIVVEPAAGGEKTRVQIVGPASAPASAPAPAASPAPSSPDLKSAAENLPKEFVFNPMGMLNLAWEAKAMAEMKQIFMGAATYFAEEEKVPDLKTLVERRFVSKTLDDGESGGYRFRIEKGGGNSFEVFADPTNPKSSLRHFMMDEEGTLRIEMGKPATGKSKAYMD